MNKEELRSGFNTLFGLAIIVFIVWMVIDNDMLKTTRTIRMEDGHQYIESRGYDGSCSYTHLEGCDHPSHKKQ